MQIIRIALILLLTLLSGAGDSQGFIHASKIWNQNRLVLPELFASALFFALGIFAYWIAIRFLQNVHIVSPAVQTLGWFLITIIGVGLTSGDFFHWQRVDQLISVLLIVGMIWLIIRTSS